MSGSGIMPCIKFDKPLVVYIFSNVVITSILMVRTHDKILMFSCQQCNFKVVLMSYNIESNICAPVSLNFIKLVAKKR